MLLCTFQNNYSEFYNRKIMLSQYLEIENGIDYSELRRFGNSLWRLWHLPFS